MSKELILNGINSKAALAPPKFYDVNDVEIIQGCKAWVYFNGNGVVSIWDSFNVLSITDNGVGTFQVNFTNNMPNANFCISATGGNGAVFMGDSAGKTVSRFVLDVRNSAGTKVDDAYLNCSVFSN